MDSLQKQFVRMISYSAIGVLVGGLIGTIFGAFIGFLYYHFTPVSEVALYNAYHGNPIINPSYSIFAGIVGGILAAVYVMRASKTDEKLNNLPKNFAMLVVYCILGMIFGSLVAVSYGFILALVYGVILKSLTYGDMQGLFHTPLLPLVGGMFGAILTGVLVIKMSKAEKN